VGERPVRAEAPDVPGGVADGVPGGGLFRRTVEDFVCGHCGAQVRGNGYTNHCPVCLWSRHVDVNPGDRSSTCGGFMPPIAALHEDGTTHVVQRCEVCGHQRRNRLAPRDDRGAVLALFGRPVPAAPVEPSSRPGRGRPRGRSRRTGR
jgi:hypothetical protein